MGRMLTSGELLLLSSSDAGATKLKPLKSWWAFALGGMPGESAHRKHTQNTTQVIIEPLADTRVSTVIAREHILHRTFGSFGCEFWVEAESVIWFPCSRFEWRLKFFSVQFLNRHNKHMALQ